MSRLDGKMLTVDREDRVITNKHKEKIHLSVFQTGKKSRGDPPVPTIIYLHSNNGSRQ